MQSELYPLAVWSLGSGGTDNFVMRLTFLPLTDAVRPSWIFVLYAGISIARYYSLFRIYLKTAGLSLEERRHLSITDRQYGSEIMLCRREHTSFYF